MTNRTVKLPHTGVTVQPTPQELEMIEEDEANLHLVLATDEARRKYLGLTQDEWDTLMLCSQEEINQLDEMSRQEIKEYLVNKAKHL